VSHDAIPARGPMHLHLDALGGLAGDMFVAALLDLAPELETRARDVAHRVHPGLDIARAPGTDSGIAGSRLTITLPSRTDKRAPRHYADYDELLRLAAPSPAVATRARDILRRLAEAEARVHGLPLPMVHFHEIADWDSIADILLSAWLIETLVIASASAAPLPTGSGRVTTQHGPMPVPAPATLELLKGVPVFDDGIAGERVTPTGAAILAHLAPSPRLPAHTVIAKAIGYGLGTRRMPGIANALRATLWQASEDRVESVGVIGFAVDDQTGEDLAVGLDRLRAAPGVLDVLQLPALGKKGRMAARIEIICRSEHLDRVAELCLLETTTIGVRLHYERRLVLPRRVAERHGLRIKSATRPDGSDTIKAEMDDVAPAGNHAERQKARRRLEDPS
jgi:uncharacterized protein (TIGR00299 family) protein